MHLSSHDVAAMCEYLSHCAIAEAANATTTASPQCWANGTSKPDHMEMTRLVTLKRIMDSLIASKGVKGMRKWFNEHTVVIDGNALKPVQAIGQDELVATENAALRYASKR